MRRVYIAGPITKGDLKHNVDQATEAYLQLAKAGIAPHCPHWSVYCKEAFRFDGGVFCKATTDGSPDMSHAQWLAIDFAWIDVSDAILRLPGESTGADMEVKHANERKIPVCYSVDEVIEWFASQDGRGVS